MKLFCNVQLILLISSKYIIFFDDEVCIYHIRHSLRHATVNNFEQCRVFFFKFI